MNQDGIIPGVADPIHPIEYRTCRAPVLLFFPL